MARLNVDKWQQGRPEWNYDPSLQFWWRLAQCALQDAMKVDKDGRPSDLALVARDWFARSEPAPKSIGKRQFASFPEVCHWLGLNLEAERVSVLEMIDKAGDFDTPECDERLEKLIQTNADDEIVMFEVPEMFRIVPVRDQGSLFAMAG